MAWVIPKEASLWKLNMKIIIRSTIKSVLSQVINC